MTAQDIITRLLQALAGAAHALAKALERMAGARLPPEEEPSRPGRHEAREEIPDPTPFGPVSATRPWLTGHAPGVDPRSAGQAAPKLAPEMRGRPMIGRALAILARRRAQAAAATGMPHTSPDAQATGREAYPAANTDRAASAKRRAEPRVAPEVRSFRPTGGSWATAERPTPSNDAAERPAPAQAAIPLTDWPWRPHGRSADAPGELPSAQADHPIRR